MDCFSIFIALGLLLILISEIGSGKKKSTHSHGRKENAANSQYIDALFVLDAAQHGVFVPGAERVFRELDNGEEEEDGPGPDDEDDFDYGPDYDDPDDDFEQERY